MTRYLLSRVLLVVPVLFGVTVLAFLMVHLVPGDPVSVMLGNRGRRRMRPGCGRNWG